ncbi:cytochrome c oxidase assembly protein [Aquihabitans sp. G128]|uniref:cytochrome c oxidase assembly protein n=1 Tax=Aquihabitans sp. G128 TaxID=2849779 RepID=UPI001C214447|nr:cytochrome c oxidase assembly protein [Aquihabitans sp. G128]QXC61535.1 cytochrome c oxidase assembly protein [Aquihabitans sp. G128]
MPSITLGDVVLGWRLDPAAALVAVAGSVAYGRGVRDLARRGHRWPRLRTTAFAVAVVALAVATQSGIGRYDDQRLTIHMVQHLLLGMVVPFALVCSAPLTLALQTGRSGTRRLVRKALHHPVARLVTNPIATWVLFGGGIVAIYLTPLLDLSARNGLVHLAVHVHLVTTGSLFLAGLVGADPSPRPLPHGARLLSALTAVPFHAFLGLAMLSADAPLAPRAYPSLPDQRTAAGLLWGMGELFTLAVAAVVVRRWYVTDQRAAARFDRQDDARRLAAATEPE